MDQAIPRGARALESTLGRFVSFWSTPHRLYVASLLRIGLGLMSLLYFVSHYTEHAFLLGPNGMIDWQYYIRNAAPAQFFTLYAWSQAPMWAEFLYFASIIVSITYLVGVFPRLSGFVLVVLVDSAFSRNWEVLDGGHNILGLMLIYLCFADLRANALFAPPILHVVTRPLGNVGRHLVATGDYLNAVLHNAAMTLVVLQLCQLYFFSGFYKIQGHKWQDGTAVYYVMRTDEFSFPPFSAEIYRNATLVTILTLSTVVFQISFPFLMWNRRAKPFLFAAAILFHAGIAIFMGLVLFSMMMIVADLALFDDRTILGGLARIRAWRDVSRPIPSVPLAAEKR